MYSHWIISELQEALFSPKDASTYPVTDPVPLTLCHQCPCRSHCLQAQQGAGRESLETPLRAFPN